MTERKEKPITRSEVTTHISENIRAFYSMSYWAFKREVGLIQALPKQKYVRRTSRRVDAIAVSRKGRIEIVEGKSCIEDYWGDNKWQDYLLFCNRFWFIAPPEVASKIADSTPSHVGVLEARMENTSWRPKILRKAEDTEMQADPFLILWLMARTGNR